MSVRWCAWALSTHKWLLPHSALLCHHQVRHCLLLLYPPLLLLRGCVYVLCFVLEMLFHISSSCTFCWKWGRRAQSRGPLPVRDWLQPQYLLLTYWCSCRSSLLVWLSSSAFCLLLFLLLLLFSVVLTEVWGSQCWEWYEPEKFELLRSSASFCLCTGFLLSLLLLLLLCIPHKSYHCHWHICSVINRLCWCHWQ